MHISDNFKLIGWIQTRSRSPKGNNSMNINSTDFEEKLTKLENDFNDKLDKLFVGNLGRKEDQEMKDLSFNKKALDEVKLMFDERFKILDDKF